MVRGEALRRSVTIQPNKAAMSDPEFAEPHRRGELVVAAVMNAFLDIWLSRLAKIGPIANGKKDRSIVRDEGARAAGHLLTMAIRAIDYCPPTDLTFSDYLSALLTIDREVVPDDGKYGYRAALLENFNAYGIAKAGETEDDGTWRRCKLDLGVVGDVRLTIQALLPLLKAKSERKHLDAAIAHYKSAREGLDALAKCTPGRKPIHPQGDQAECLQPIEGGAEPVGVVITESLCSQEGGDRGQIRMDWWA